MNSNQFGPPRSSMKFVAIVFLVGACVALLYAQKTYQEAKPEQEINTKLHSNAESDALVTKYLQETNKKIEAKKLLDSMSSSFRAPKVGQMLPITPESKKPIELEPTEDGSARHGPLPQDISSDDNSPRAVIEHQLNDQQRLEAYDREYHQKYIQAFVDNARRNGWNIRVNKNGVVTESSPIPGFQESRENPPTSLFGPAAEDY